MWIDTTQVYGFSNPDEWREAENFAENLRKSGVPFSWYIWEKGYKGETVVKWFN